VRLPRPLSAVVIAAGSRRHRRQDRQPNRWRRPSQRKARNAPPKPKGFNWRKRTKRRCSGKRGTRNVMGMPPRMRAV
jgi:hypothetical protein